MIVILLVILYAAIGRLSFMFFRWARDRQITTNVQAAMITDRNLLSTGFLWPIAFVGFMIGFAMGVLGAIYKAL